MALSARLHVASPPRWPGWAHLPRDTRDVLFLLGIIGWTLLPHLGHLPWWCGALAGVVLVWRAHIALAGARLPSRLWVVLVLAIAIGLTFTTHNTLLGKEAGVTLLAVLMVLKTLELRARRDAFVVFFLGFFLVLTHFLYSQSIAVAAAMVVSVWGLLTALVLAHLPVGRPSLRLAGGLAARAALLGAPLMLLLFLLFPRFGPLWGLPQDAAARTGLSGQMSLGSVAELASDDSIALRLRFAGAAPPPQALYLRGPVLSRFDGREWRRGDAPAPSRELRLQGSPVDYEMTLEPSRLPLLPLLEATPDVDGAAPRLDGWRVALRPDLEWTVSRPVTERLRFSARAWLRFEHGPTTPAPVLAEALQLPPGHNPRTLAWAQALRQRHGDDAAALSAAVLRHVREAGFSYTLAPGVYGEAPGSHAIDEFWLDRRRGFCEHFASAYVVVLRAAGVPARVVTGYQGADREPQDGWLVVRNSHAHAWAEYWLPGRGWVRADPTAAVAPDRVERSFNLAPAPGLVAGALGAVDPRLLAQLRGVWERVDNRWNQWVLNYSRSDQFDLVRELGMTSPNWMDLALLLLGALSAAALVGAAWALHDRRRQDPWQRLRQCIGGQLAALGIDAPPHEAPRALAARVRAARGDAGEALAQSLEALERQRYGSAAAIRPDPAWWSGFARAARAARRGPG